jgi:hypothetical protein
MFVCAPHFKNRLFTDMHAHSLITRGNLPLDNTLLIIIRNVIVVTPQCYYIIRNVIISSAMLSSAMLLSSTYNIHIHIRSKVSKISMYHTFLDCVLETVYNVAGMCVLHHRLYICINQCVPLFN